MTPGQAAKYRVDLFKQLMAERKANCTYDAVDEEMEMDEGWEEDDDDANSDQGIGEDETELCQERPGDAPAASEVCVGPSMGLGFGRSRTLDANCLLYQPIAGYVRWPEGANFAMPSYAFTF